MARTTAKTALAAPMLLDVAAPLFEALQEWRCSKTVSSYSKCGSEVGVEAKKKRGKNKKK